MSFNKELKSFRFQEGKSNIIYLGIILLVAVILAAIIIWGINRKDGEVTILPIKSKETKKTEPQSPVKLSEGVTLTQTSEIGDLPGGFPEIPLNGKQEISNSFTLDYQNSNSNQKVIDFTSLESTKKNFEFYKDWSKNNGWNIFHETNNENEARLIIEKEKKVLNIVMVKNNNTSKITMSW